MEVTRIADLPPKSINCPRIELDFVNSFTKIKTLGVNGRGATAARQATADDYY
jgi:hypothetical protein